MAELYLARTVGIEGFEKLVVVKRILPQHASNASFVEMFLNEARLAATLHHPNVAQVYDIGVDGGEYFFAMEYVHGEDLDEITAQSNEQGVSLAMDAALTLVSHLCAGLHYAHEKLGPDGKPLEIVHRDVSPSNVLVSYDGAVKLVDFGIARAARKQTTSRGGLKGKIAYMSPEQCRASGQLDRRSDLFSVGMILYELTTGQLPFTGETEYQLLDQIVNRDVPPPSTLVPSYPPALEQIVLRALARDRDQRYATALELQGHLEDFAHENRLRVSPLVLARLMSSLYPARLEEWAHAKAQGVFFVEQHVVRTLIEDGKTPGDPAHRAASHASDDDDAEQTSVDPLAQDTSFDQPPPYLVGEPPSGATPTPTRRASTPSGATPSGVTRRAPTPPTATPSGPLRAPTSPTASLRVDRAPTDRAPMDPRTMTPPRALTPPAATPRAATDPRAPTPLPPPPAAPAPRNTPSSLAASAPAAVAAPTRNTPSSTPAAAAPRRETPRSMAATTPPPTRATPRSMAATTPPPTRATPVPGVPGAVPSVPMNAGVHVTSSTSNQPSIPPTPRSKPSLSTVALPLPPPQPPEHPEAPPVAATPVPIAASHAQADVTERVRISRRASSDTSHVRAVRTRSPLVWLAGLLVIGGGLAAVIALRGDAGPDDATASTSTVNMTASPADEAKPAPAADEAKPAPAAAEVKAAEPAPPASADEANPSEPAPPRTTTEAPTVPSPSTPAVDAKAEAPAAPSLAPPPASSKPAPKKPRAVAKPAKIVRKPAAPPPPPPPKEPKSWNADSPFMPVRTH